MSKNRTHDLLHKGNNFLFIGTIWGFVAAFLCPCPYCVMGTLSFLGAGLVSKLGLGQEWLEKIKAMEREHDHAHREKGDAPASGRYPDVDD